MAYVLPPLVNDDGGKAVGPGIALATDLAQAAGLDTSIELLPITRAFQAIEAGNTIVVAMGRTPEREGKYTWITEVFVDTLAFATLAPHGQIDTLDTAKSVKEILVARDTVPERYLMEKGFGNLSPQKIDILNARMLQGGRAEAWFGSTAVIKSLWRAEKFEDAKLVVGKPVFQISFWLGASKDVPEDVVRKMVSRYNELKSNGGYDKIFSSVR